MDDPRVLTCGDTHLERYTISDDEIAAAAELRQHLEAIERQESRTRGEVVKAARALRFSRGMRGYAVALAALKHEPLSSHALAARVTLQQSTAAAILHQLHFLGMVHVSNWTRPSGLGPYVAQWAFGSGADVPAPTPGSAHMATFRLKPRPDIGVEMLTFSAIWHALVDAHSSVMLAEISGADRQCINRLMHAMRTLQLVYIAEWDRASGRAPQPMYRLGSKKTADRPPTLSRTEISRRYLHRKSQRTQAARLFEVAANPFECMTLDLTNARSN